MVLTTNTTYNGDLIHKRFAYQFLRDKVSPIGDIVCFRGGMNVTTNLIDQEDLINKDYIYSGDAINFIWEIPNLCPFGAVAFQRLFNTQIANLLSIKYIQKPIEVDGDDLLVHDRFVGSDGKDYEKGKASVSITYSTNNVAIGHTGINIDAGRLAPGFAYSTKLSDEQADAFMNDVNQMFYVMCMDAFVATTKVIV
jgi:hypothetical protein